MKLKFVGLAVVCVLLTAGQTQARKKDKTAPELLLKKPALGTEYRWSQADQKWFWYDASSLQNKSEKYIEMKGWTQDDVTRKKKLDVVVKWYDKTGEKVREHAVPHSELVKNKKRKDFNFSDYYRGMRKGFGTMRIVVTVEDRSGKVTERSTRVFEKGFPKKERSKLMKEEDPGELSVKRTFGSMMDRDIDSKDAKTTAEKTRRARPVE